MLEWDVPVPGEFRIELVIAPYGKDDDWCFDFCQKPADPALAKCGDYPFLVLRFSKAGATAVFGEWDEVKEGGSGEPVKFPYKKGSNLRLSIVYKGGKVSAYANGSGKPFLETEDYSDYLNAVKEGKLQFNGAKAKIHSLKVMRP